MDVVLRRDLNARSFASFAGSVILTLSSLVKSPARRYIIFLLPCLHFVSTAARALKMARGLRSLLATAAAGSGGDGSSRDDCES